MYGEIVSKLKNEKISKKIPIGRLTPTESFSEELLVDDVDQSQLKLDRIKEAAMKLKSKKQSNRRAEKDRNEVVTLW